MPMIGQSIKRREDLKYVTGSGTYVDDITLPGMLYAAFVRSPPRPRQAAGSGHDEGPGAPQGHRRRDRGRSLRGGGRNARLQLPRGGGHQEARLPLSGPRPGALRGRAGGAGGGGGPLRGGGRGRAGRGSVRASGTADGPGRVHQTGRAEAARQPRQQRGTAHRAPGRRHGGRLPGGRLRLQKALPHAPPYRDAHRDPGLHRTVQHRHPGADPALLDPRSRTS